MVQNRDVAKEIQVGMLVAIGENSFPKVGKVAAVSPNPSLDSKINVQWMVQERAPHKPRWQRSFKIGPREILGEIELRNVLLYDFQLTNKGCLKKKSRDYLKSILEI